ncbi:MAG: glycosyltransferase [Roseburia sp.]|nr:glycosyltransferase [Roseburia sp.]
MISMNYKVSIITVVYNGAATIEQTIQSILHQTYDNIEYIIIDGASTDGTQQIIEKYADSISCYVSEKDDGLYYAMNKGIEKATGEIIGIVNSDDWYADDAIESVVSFFGQNDVELTYGKIVAVSGGHGKKIIGNMPLESIWYQMALPHPSVFVKKEVYDKLGIFDVRYRLAADYELLLRFYSKKVTFGYIDKVITYFREGGLSTKRKKEMYDEGYKISMSYADQCPYKEQVISQIKETYNWACFSMDMQNLKGLMSKLLCEYFRKTVMTVAIFGTGTWAEECYRNLADGHVRILYFSDNNKSKWDTYFHEIKVISPDELQNMDISVLIAVKEKGEEIKQQLESEDNTKLKCVSIKELATMYLTKKII